MQKQSKQRPADLHRQERLRRQELQRKRYRRRLFLLRAGVILFIAVIAVAGGLLYKSIRADRSASNRWHVEASGDDIASKRPPMDVALLEPNEYSRPQTPLEKVNGIVIHYTANPMTGAMDNRNYFDGLKDSHLTYASSHFVVGLHGDIIQCIPTSEISYASNDRNSDTISIEVCHPDETGKFNDETYDALVWLTGWLCEYLEVEPEGIIRHYDVTGKVCPKYFVEHEDAWNTFKEDVRQWIEVN